MIINGLSLVKNSMAHREEQKQKLKDFILDGLGRYTFYAKTTLGIPEDITAENLAGLKTLGEQMNFLNNASIDHPKVFEGMKPYTP